jgi:hypothetical protein
VIIPHTKQNKHMDLEDIKGLKFYILYCFLLVAFFVYSGLTGLKWFNSTKTESERPVGRSGHVYRYHK